MGKQVESKQVERLVRELERLERLEGDIAIRLPGALSELLEERGGRIVTVDRAVLRLVERGRLTIPCRVLRLLAILYEHGSMPLHHAHRYGMGVGTTYRSAQEAAMLGLVRLYHCGAARCAELTPQGRRVAEKLHELLHVLEEELR